MLTLHVSRLLHIRGIQKPYNFLRNLGLSHNVAHRMLSDKAVGIKLYQLQKLCLALHCTPNDLMAWDSTQTSLSADHPIMELVRPAEDSLTVGELRQLPLAKLNQIKQLLKDMES
ncbi:helix-turn-helix transcriptional regulator [Reichenbachiella agarivorans]|uniref:Helix-turn-helix transcriptional regulator n=1 Tax=Reichenbachiella agarivorans TaxID=2979464 RepID=A0ABY6CT91_9BACT|nr:helix-turn-helix transcriptional regulator [Reichenbachiella agarivorans]UXP32678.1 helix-turn-helix transcriptional regulator [Reichenbachiella agarivorans]